MDALNYHDVAGRKCKKMPCRSFPIGGTLRNNSMFDFI